DRRIKADSHIESENMHISTAHLVGRLKTTAIQHKSLNLGVNDGSTDDTARVIEPYLEDKRVKLVSQDNKGVSAARNRAIAHSRGNYIAFLDADDYYLPHTIKNYLEAIERTKGSLHSITATTCESTRKAK
ncbi:MAG: glycosyltransferase family A protein, partial [Prosthecochloris sp.]|nr:glycosyltransferase family A protein [Prosthecochloris sp.]